MIVFIRYFFPLLILVIGVSGCSSNIPELIRSAPKADIELAEVQSNPKIFVGSSVRWGGNIVSVENFNSYTMVEILGRSLSNDGEPNDSGKSKGRFLAKLAGFLDPEDYPKGRLMSVTGKLAANISKRIGEYLYEYPVVEAEVYYLWPEPEFYPYPYPYYRDPFFYPWYPYGYRYPYFW